MGTFNINVKGMCLVHNVESELKRRLFELTLHALSQAEIETTIFPSSETSSSIIQLINRTKHVKLGDEQNGGEWEAFRAAYESVNADLVAVCHQDDQWVHPKIREQVRIMNLNSTPLSITSYILIEDPRNHRVNPTSLQEPQFHSEYGLINCMPSTWILNKRIVDSIPDPFGPIACKDIGIGIELSQIAPIEALLKPFTLYNNHHQNGWNGLADNFIDEGRKALKILAENETIQMNFRS